VLQPVVLMSLCQAFRRRAARTWDLIDRAERSKHRLGEETITDLNLLELKERHPSEIIVTTYTKPVEGREGADWEWWLTGRSKLWLGFRVQAKIIDTSTATFPHLHYRKNANSPYQSDTLITRSLTAVPPRIPVYCLYSYWAPSFGNPVWDCRRFPPRAHAYGCSLLSAYAVVRLRISAAANALSHVRPDMTPWHCLICCSGYGGGDLPTRASSYWRATRLEKDRQVLSLRPGADDAGSADLFATYARIAPVDSPPAYVLAAMEGIAVEERDPALQGLFIVSEGRGVAA